MKGGSDAEVTAAVHKMLLARHQAYRKAGLEGIAPYDRGSDPRSAGADLRTASEASATLKQLAPDFYNLLIQYPADKPGGMLERYDWSRYQAHGAPTEILTHRAAHTEGEAYIVLQRQFYASGGYNSVQALAGFFPVKEGTLVVYTNRTSTDQVAGFGGGAKRSIGSKVMASELTALYGRVQQAAEK